MYTELLAQFREDCEEALAKTIQYRKDNPDEFRQYAVNWADLRVVEVCVKIYEEGYVHVHACIEEISPDTTGFHGYLCSFLPLTKKENGPNVYVFDGKEYGVEIETAW